MARGCDLSRFQGRRKELALLELQLDETATGRGWRLVTVVAESLEKKSRLAAELAGAGIDLPSP